MGSLACNIHQVKNSLVHFVTFIQVLRKISRKVQKFLVLILVPNKNMLSFPVIIFPVGIRGFCTPANFTYGWFSKLKIWVIWLRCLLKPVQICLPVNFLEVLQVFLHVHLNWIILNFFYFFSQIRAVNINFLAIDHKIVL